MHKTKAHTQGSCECLVCGDFFPSQSELEVHQEDKHEVSTSKHTSTHSHIIQKTLSTKRAAEEIEEEELVEQDPDRFYCPEPNCTHKAGWAHRRGLRDHIHKVCQ
jgi:hypothetical protein